MKPAVIYLCILITLIPAFASSEEQTRLVETIAAFTTYCNFLEEHIGNVSSPDEAAETLERFTSLFDEFVTAMIAYATRHPEVIRAPLPPKELEDSMRALSLLGADGGAMSLAFQVGQLAKRYNSDPRVLRSMQTFQKTMSTYHKYTQSQESER